MHKNSKIKLKCTNCGTETTLSVRNLHCFNCGSLYDLRYSAPAEPTAPRLPLRSSSRVSLGEGNTPIVELTRTAGVLGLSKLWAKQEFMSPTGSFKDRGSSITVSAAVEEGVEEVVEDSSGNAGASLAAYCSAGGVRAHVFAPADAPPGKLQQIAMFGATLHSIVGPRQAATDAALEFVAGNDAVYLSHNESPLFIEGLKAVAYELIMSVASDATHIVIPTGNGSLLMGLRKGFNELIEAGVIDASPRLHCIQSVAVRPLESKINETEWQYDPLIRTIAGGIASPFPPRLGEALDAVRSTGGSAVAVPDSETLDWQRKLAIQEGIYCEATSAVALAGLFKLIDIGVIQRGDAVVVPITGSGLKESRPSHQAA